MPLLPSQVSTTKKEAPGGGSFEEEIVEEEFFEESSTTMSSTSFSGGGGDPFASLGFGDLASGGAGSLLSKMGGVGDMMGGMGEISIPMMKGAPMAAAGAGAASGVTNTAVTTTQEHMKSDKGQVKRGHEQQSISIIQ